MKTKSIIALTAALMLCTSSTTFAQDASGNVGAGVSVDGGASAGGTSVDVGADAGVDVTLDTNSDGTVDDDEAAAGGSTDGSAGGSTGGATGGASGGASGGADLDTDGDGTISEEEQAAGAANDDEDGMLSSIEDCASVDMSAMGTMAADTVASISTATSVNVVRLTDCEDDSGADLDSGVESALFGNETIAAQLAQEGVGGGEILGVSGSSGAITVYVAQDDTESNDEGAAEETSTDGTTSQ